LKAELDKKKIRLNAESYGLLIKTLTHRNQVRQGSYIAAYFSCYSFDFFPQLIDSLRLLEEAAGLGVSTSEKYLSHIRARCTKLGIEHPDIPKDPHAWVKVLKKARVDARKSSARRLGSLKDGVYS
jgi:hypothetical protein